MSDTPSTPMSTTPGGTSTSAPAAPITITRTGGIAGVHDVLEITPDGTARLTRRNGESILCTPIPALLDRLRSIDLRAVGTGPPKVPVADGFTYTVVSAAGTASAGDGDSGIRAELVSAAAAVLASCQAPTSGTGTEGASES